MPSSANFGKLKPLTMKPAKNLGGVIWAVDVMWARTCSTFHASHNEGVAHCVVPEAGEVVGEGAAFGGDRSSTCPPCGQRSRRAPA